MAAQEPEDFGVDEPPLKHPDKVKLEKDKQYLTAQINHLENQLRSCDTTVDVGERLRPLQTSRDALREQHRLTDERLQALAPRITETRCAIFKLRDKLKYRTEAQVDDAVARLERQLQTHNFKLREEEKIVREINDLKKSKRTLRECDAKKNELEALNQKQRALRGERDRFYGQIDKSKREEERIQRDAQSTAANVDMLNRELSELRAQRQALQDAYQQQLDAWQAWQRQSGGRRRPQKARDERPAPPLVPAAAAEGRLPPEPYQPELNTCAQLTSYLQRLSHTPGTTPATPTARLVPSGDSTPICSGGASPRTPLADPAWTELPAWDGGPTMFLLRRKDDEPAPAPAAAAASRAKRRRDRRGSSRARPLTHTSEIFHHFCLLDLKPPSTSKDVPAALEQVKAKQKYFQMCALKAKQEERPERRPAAGGGVAPLTLRLRSSLSVSGDSETRTPPPGELVTMHSIGVQLPYQLTMAPPASYHPPEVTWPAPPPPPPQPEVTWPVPSAQPEVTWPAPPPQPEVTWPAPGPQRQVTWPAAAECSRVDALVSRPSSRDSGVPSAPLSAEATDADRNPFAEALQSQLSTGSAAQRQQTVLEVPTVTQ